MPGGNLLVEIPRSTSQEIFWGESACRNTQICQSIKLPEWNLLVPKSASQEICLGGICWQKYPNLLISKAAWGESANRNTKICQSGNLLGGICWQKCLNLPVSKAASRFTKYVSRNTHICQSGNLLGESACRSTQICQLGNLPADSPNMPVRKSAGERESVGRRFQICQSGNLPGRICGQKYPNLPVKKSAWRESANRNIQIYQSVKLPADSPNMSAEIPISASQEICWGKSASRNTQICQ